MRYQSLHLWPKYLMFSSPCDIKLRFVLCNHHKSGNAGNADNVVQEFASTMCNSDWLYILKADATDKCWLVDKWAGREQGVTGEFTGNGRTAKKFQKIKNETTDSGCSGLFVVFNTAVLQLSVCYNFALLPSWLTGQQQHEQQWPIDRL